MKLLHTSDWHLGRSLYGRKRTEEYQSFLNWLADLTEEQEIDVLLIAGDIFDTTTPSNRMQELYYGFLQRIIKSRCQHVIIIGGNHDSPSFLEAPAPLLKGLCVTIIGAINDDPSRQVIPIFSSTVSQDDDPDLLVCAVPYLREKDVRAVEPGESLSDKAKKLINGIQEHYQRIIELAVAFPKKNSDKHIPIIATGHLFATGGRIDSDDGVRDLYVGSLAHISPTLFPREIDYLALGHLHRCQRIGESDFKRYCGSPLPMSFAESGATKYVISLSISGQVDKITPIEVPTFQKLRSIKGNLPALLQQLVSLRKTKHAIWLEIIYDGQEIIGDLQEQLHDCVHGSNLEILRIVNEKIIEKTLRTSPEMHQLEDLSIEEVFQKCIDQNDIPTKQHPELKARFSQALNDLKENDDNAR